MASKIVNVTGAVSAQVGIGASDANSKMRLKFLIASCVGDGSITFYDDSTQILPTIYMSSNSVFTLNLKDLGIEVLNNLKYTTTGFTTSSFQVGYDLVGK